MSRADRYTSLGADYHWRWWVNNPEYRRWINRLLSEFPVDGNGATVLDLGCGDGVPASQLMARGYTVHGVEYLPEPLAVAQAKLPECTFSDSIPDEVFDYVLITDALKDLTSDPLMVQVVSNCRQYAVVTAPTAAYSQYTLGQVFRGCHIEMIFEEDDHRAYLVEPDRD